MIATDRAVARWSFEFPTREFYAESTAGCAYRRRLWTGMPVIPPALLKSSFYLYKTRKDAKAGDNYGGTGFFIGIRSVVDPMRMHTLGVSNWHVTVDLGFPVVRVNKEGGGVDIFEFDSSEWIFIPNSHDVAIIPIDLNATHDVTIAYAELLLTEKFAIDNHIGPGDDVFMVGRFMDHDGGKTNEPAVRFGHISMRPTPIKQPARSISCDSYVIDVHSRTGYSGSPVFVYSTIPSNIGHLFSSESPTWQTVQPRQFLNILGIMWGYFPELWEITQKSKTKTAAGLPLVGQYVEGMSGMSCVVPAWEINKLLQHPKITRWLAREEQMIRDMGEPIVKPA